MAIKNYSTTVSAMQSVGEITIALAKHNAKEISQNYKNGKITAVSFVIDTPAGEQRVLLPADVERFRAVLQNQKVKCDYEHAEMVAWRNVRDWVLAQMALLETAMVSFAEIFLPYIATPNGGTIYELFEQNILQLNPAKNNE